MAAEIAVTPATIEDARELAANLRAQDIAEMRAYGHEDPVAPLVQSVERSLYARTVRADGELVCVFGLAPLSLLSGLGAPWMMATPLLQKNARILQRLAPAYIAAMLESCPRLVNTVHARNTVSLRWLKRLGFVIHLPIQSPRTGELFHPFEWRG